ncbi:GNAT family N-acetyltransferase [Metabacillus iocasae]|uniref:N-acetyltransferase YhbS n=1 Tax=Priestia iocasae TaxID=2291674 RepID=A0ABS2QVF8_9BACI|nr:N-acetyltransferase [Metabacillus iocasae]MBM7702927.1 putative N-acetyltransferase YhbS [Metabacillus iocasae]
MSIRIEQKSDIEVIDSVIKQAFKDLPFSDQTEHELVKRLRKCKEWIPELSLVYEQDGNIVGHLLVTKAYIGKERVETLALAPVSVLPAYQKREIGKKLIEHGLNVSAQLGFGSMIVLGHPTYYSKFGFERASKYKIEAPFEVADELFMVKELGKGRLDGVSGVVAYSDAF